MNTLKKGIIVLAFATITLFITIICFRSRSTKASGSADTNSVDNDLEDSDYEVMWKSPPSGFGLRGLDAPIKFERSVKPSDLLLSKKLTQQKVSRFESNLSNIYYCVKQRYNNAYDMSTSFNHTLSGKNVVRPFLDALLSCSHNSEASFTNMLRTIPLASMRFTFSNQEGIDAGGLRRSFFSMFFAQARGEVTPQMRANLQFAENEKVPKVNIMLKQAEYKLKDDNKTYFCYHILNDNEMESKYYFAFGSFLSYAFANEMPIGYELCPGVLKSLIGLPLNCNDAYYQMYSQFKALNVNDFDVLEYVENTLKDDEDGEDLSNVFSKNPVMLTKDDVSKAKDGNDEAKRRVEAKKADLEAKKIEAAEIVLITRCENNLDAMRRGFQALIPETFFSYMDIDERKLGLMLVGKTTIDFEQLKNSFTVQRIGDLNENTCNEFVEKFWNMVSGLDQSQLQLFWSFVTGNDSVPVSGYGQNTLQVKQEDIQSRLFVSHTCSNALEFSITYEYIGDGWKERLKERFLQSIASQDFALM